MADMLKLNPIPASRISRKSIRCSELRIPFRRKGMAIPTVKLMERESANPAYCGAYGIYRGFIYEVFWLCHRNFHNHLQHVVLDFYPIIVDGQNSKEKRFLI